MASSSTSTSAEKDIYTLLGEVSDNFKYLADCYRGNDILQTNELDNLQTETITAIGQIEIIHNTKVVFLKEGIIEENEAKLFNQ